MKLDVSLQKKILWSAVPNGVEIQTGKMEDIQSNIKSIRKIP